METLRIALRLIHIFSGTIWVGSAFFITLFFEPLIRAAGAEGGRFMERLMTQTAFVKYMILSSLLTLSTGIVLYGIDSGFEAAWILSREGIIFSIGSLAGVGAYLTGQFLIAPTVQRISVLGREMAMAGGPPLPLQVTEMSLLEVRAGRFGRLELVLMVISIFGMAGARIF